MPEVEATPESPEAGDKKTTAQAKGRAYTSRDRRHRNAPASTEAVMAVESANAVAAAQIESMSAELAGLAAKIEALTTMGEVDLPPELAALMEEQPIPPSTEEAEANALRYWHIKVFAKAGEGVLVGPCAYGTRVFTFMREEEVFVPDGVVNGLESANEATIPAVDWDRVERNDYDPKQGFPYIRLHMNRFPFAKYREVTEAEFKLFMRCGNMKNYNEVVAKLGDRAPGRIGTQAKVG